MSSRMKAKGLLCNIDWCNREVLARGLCAGHYQRNKNGYNMDKAWRVPEPQEALCSIGHCVRKPTARNLCKIHYRRWWKYGDPNCITKMCEIVDCLRPLRSSRYCGKHYYRLVTHGDPLASKYDRESEWTVNSDGYLRKTIQINGRPRQLLQHRLLMEELLGRPLAKFENVHHLNGVRHDNRPENLELWTKPQAVGQRVHDLVAWVCENYRAEVIHKLANGERA